MSPKNNLNPGRVWQWPTLIVTLLVLTIILFTCGTEDSSDTSADQKQLYTCGMHPQVIQEEPGNCPICGMKLTPMKDTESAGKPVTHSPQAHSEQSGEMAEMDSAPKGKNGDKKILYWRAPMDPTYISDKPGKSPMGMDLIPVYEGQEPGNGSAITIDPVTVQSMGVRTSEVQKETLSHVIRTVGHIDYNEGTLYTVNTKFPGWIERLYVDRTGDFVSENQPLFEVYSPELVTTQEEYLLAFRNQKKLAESDFQELAAGSRDLLKATRRRLELWDIPEKDIAALEQTDEIKKTLTFYSPVNGVVVHKNAIEGSYIKAGMDLFRIADLSTVWVYAHIFEYELPWIEQGQTVEVELPYMPGQRFVGKIEYIYPYLNPQTRDVKVRLVFHNPKLQLKPEMYANIFVTSATDKEVVVVPSEAIIRSGERNIVFLDLGKGKFRPQDVKLGPEGKDAKVQILAGLQEGQRIVTSAQFLLDSESRLREAIQKMMQSRSQSGTEKQTAAQMATPQQHQH